MFSDCAIMIKLYFLLVDEEIENYVDLRLVADGLSKLHADVGVVVGWGGFHFRLALHFPSLMILLYIFPKIIKDKF